MAFDINPQGIKMHLQQVERDASASIAHSRADSKETGAPRKAPSARQPWLMRIAAALLRPRHAS